MSQVIVTTGARLHFGLLAHAPAASRRFGGVGLMLDRPGFRLVATAVESDQTDSRTLPDQYVGPAEWRSRVSDVVRRCRESTTSAITFPFRSNWELTSAIPPHIGLGSGTQLGLAVARAWSALQNEFNPDPTELAIRAGRGVRSALGIHGFHQGGLLVEAGKRACEQISPVVASVEFPAEWRLVLIWPPAERGLSGAAEVTAFAELPPMSQATSAELCRLVLLELLPAVQECDFATCSEALFQFGWLIGSYFAPAQGGVFASRRMADLVEWLRRRGVSGVGQSSWGPLIFALCPNARDANALVSDLRNSNWADCELHITSAKNSGASVELLS